jgi:hypothetical protein
VVPRSSRNKLLLHLYVSFCYFNKQICDPDFFEGLPNGMIHDCSVMEEVGAWTGNASVIEK